MPADAHIRRQALILLAIVAVALVLVFSMSIAAYIYGDPKELFRVNAPQELDMLKRLAAPLLVKPL